MTRSSFLFTAHSVKSPYNDRVCRKTRQLAKDIGVRLAKTDSPYVWDGECVNLNKISDTADVIHDLCHFMLSDPELRRIPDFGLGAAPETDYMLQAVSNKAVEAEYAASVLGALIEVKFGYDQRITMRRHNWSPPVGDNSWSVNKIQSLLDLFLDHGIIDTHGIPTMKLVTNQIV